MGFSTMQSAQQKPVFSSTANPCILHGPLQSQQQLTAVKHQGKHNISCKQLQPIQSTTIQQGEPASLAVNNVTDNQEEAVAEESPIIVHGRQRHLVQTIQHTNGFAAMLYVKGTAAPSSAARRRTAHH
jgi:hypothetical protein